VFINHSNGLSQFLLSAHRLLAPGKILFFLDGSKCRRAREGIRMQSAIDKGNKIRLVFGQGLGRVLKG
jgi:hypothetical protein